MPNISEASQATAPAVTFRCTTLVRSIFSFPVMCVFLLSAVIFGFCVKQFAEPDIWWHLRNAQNLIEYHSFSRIDAYSFTAAGLSRPNFEWLSEVPYFLAFKAWGLQGLLLVSILVSILIFTGVYYLCCRSGADCKDAVIATLLAIFLGTVSIGPRMLLFGWLCMVALLLLLDEYRRTGKGLWVIPPLFLVWINLHGSWLFGAIVLVIFVASGLVEGEWGLVMAHRWNRSQLRNLLLAGVASFVLLFINPFGYKVVLYPFDVLLRQPGAMRYIEEWQSVNFSSGNGKLALIMIFVLLGTVLLSRRRWMLHEVLLTVFALWTALVHTRFLFFLGLVLMPILAPRLKLFSPYKRELDKRGLNAAIMAAVVGSVFFLFPTATQLQQKLNVEYPTAALEFMQMQHISGRIFNQYLWGGYMEWNAPALRPFIDSRGDVFEHNGVMNDYFRVTTIEEPLETLAKYQIDYALLQPGRPLPYLLKHSPDWRLIYSDNVAALFEHVSAAAAPAGSSTSQSSK